MNKTELIDALTERLGDKKTAAAAVTGLVDVVVRTVGEGDKVTIAGFGVFEKRVRAARIARNPRTGESVTVSETAVPAFRPGVGFRAAVNGVRTPPPADGETPEETEAAETNAGTTRHTTEGGAVAPAKKVAKKSAKKPAGKKSSKKSNKKATVKD